jgi:hypothetical protein
MYEMHLALFLKAGCDSTHPCFKNHPTPGCPQCIQCSGGDAGNMEDFEEFQDYDES